MATEAKPKPRIRWSVYAGGYGAPLVRIPKTASMRGSWPGYDAECSCGWDSKTGGAIKSYIEHAVWEHKNFDCPLRKGAR